MGWVLGGKPIKLKDMADGVEEMTISRNLDKLEAEGYIKKIRTPYGLSIRVMKAKKRFNKNVESIRFNKNVESPNENVESNKTVTVDKDRIDTKQGLEEINLLIKSFEAINPNAKNFYKRPNQRSACAELISLFGFERIKNVIENTLPKTNKLEYLPTIISPTQLLEKWSSLEAGILKLKGKQKEKPKIAFQ